MKNKYVLELHNQKKKHDWMGKGEVSCFELLAICLAIIEE